MLVSSVICGSDHCLYTSTLLCKLIQSGDKPTVVFCTGSDSALGMLRSFAGRALFLKRNIRYHMRRYAKLNRLREWQDPVSAICERYKIPFVITRDIANGIRQPMDIIIHCGGLGIVKKDVLSIPKIGVLGAHQGKLPQYRGSDCLGWMVFKGDVPVVTAFFLDEGIDTGDILLYEQIDVEPADDYLSIRSKAVVLSVELVARCVEQARLGTIKRIKQDKNEGITYRKFSKYAAQLLR